MTADDGIEPAGLIKSYGAVRAVRGIDVSLARGETVALLGPNGARRKCELVGFSRIPGSPRP